MSCEICGRGSCSKIFHSIEEQISYDEMADEIKSKVKNRAINAIDGVNGEYIGEVYMIPYDDALKALEDIDY